MGVTDRFDSTLANLTEVKFLDCPLLATGFLDRDMRVSFRKDALFTLQKMITRKYMVIIIMPQREKYHP